MEEQQDQEILEVFVGYFPASGSDAVITADAAHNASLKTQGLKRRGFFTIDPTMSKAAISSMVTSTVTPFVQDSTVVFHIDHTMQAKFATKCACTPYAVDPAYGAYRSVLPGDIYQVSRTDADDYIGMGLNVDWLSNNPDFIGNPEPVMAVSSAYRINLSTGTRPTDSYLHHRFNADQQSIATNQIAMRLLKTNNTIVAQAMAQASMTGYLQGQVTAGYLQPKLVADDEVS